MTKKTAAILIALITILASGMAFFQLGLSDVALLAAIASQSSAVKVIMLGGMVLAFLRRKPVDFMVMFALILLLWHTGNRAIPTASPRVGQELAERLGAGEDVFVQVPDIYFLQHPSTRISPKIAAYKLKLLDETKGYAIIIGPPDAPLEEIGPFAIESKYLQAAEPA